MTDELTSGPAGGRGGNVSFTAGRGYRGTLADPGEHGDIMFSVAGHDVPMLTLKGDGTVLVKGKQVAEDIEVYRAFKRWIGCCTVEGPTAEGQRTSDDWRNLTAEQQAAWLLGRDKA